MSIDIQLGSPLEVPAVDFTWPGGDTEHYDRMWSLDAVVNGRKVRVRHGLGQRDVFGKRRVHSVTWLDDYPWLQAAATDDYAKSRDLVSFVKLPNNTRVVSSGQVPPDYSGIPIVEHSDEIRGPQRHKGVAFKLRDDDVEAWARCALVRAELRQVKSGDGDTDAGAAGWEEFVRWAARFYEQSDFEKDERTYKIEIADHLRDAKKVFDSNASNWIDRLQRAFGSPNNLTSWQMHDKFLRWVRTAPEAATEALKVVWTGTDSDRIGGFLGRVPKEVVGGKGSRLSLASFLQMALDEFNWPFYKPTAAEHAYELAGYPGPDRPRTEPAMYVHFLDFLDAFIDEAQERGLAIKDRLDAQGLMWSLSTKDPGPGWSAADKEAFLRYRNRALNRNTENVTDLKRLAELLIRHGADPDRLWLVVQGANYRSERSAGILQAPQVGTDGRSRTFWTAMNLLEEGDVVLHYATTAFRAVGVVIEPALETQLAGKPGETTPGWTARVEYHDLTPPIPLVSIPAEWRQDENGFTSGGAVRQGYLFRLSSGFAVKLLGGAGITVAPPSPAPPEQAITFADLIKRTLLTEAKLRELVDALQGDSYQVVLAGPPGTGKTWLARELVRYLTQGRREQASMVQFHPSYSYEQFIEGLRPVVNEANAISFERVDGIALRFAKQIRPGDPDHFLIIDEMNRANLPRVLGELMFLFEYREEHIDLPYTTDFSLPRELRFIGTMNTADRSIRSIDVALRRRFDVFECLADAGILSRYYAVAGQENHVSDLIEGFERLNGQLTEDLDKFHTIGHTFFMSEQMTPTKLREVWQRKLNPLIQEYFFDRPDRVAGYELEVLWPSLA